jgi:hypothetical protein
VHLNAVIVDKLEQQRSDTAVVIQDSAPKAPPDASVVRL